VPGAARSDLSAFAVASLAAAGAAAVVRAVEPFEHGVWLVAYLFLVGFLAQLLLGRGQAALLSAPHRSFPGPRSRRAQLILWNIGVVSVPVGVLVDARLAVVFGGAALLVALASFAHSVRGALSPDPSTPPWLIRGYVALLVFMAGSVFVGTALAWDTPWL
jgi:hypothetical protein